MTSKNNFFKIKKNIKDVRGFSEEVTTIGY